jgi:hypothetical protein
MLSSSVPPAVQWIDKSADTAYITVRGRLETFRQFLDTVGALITQPHWRPGMPVVEDLRECDWDPPPAAIAEWRDFVAKHGRLLQGCRWAVVRRPVASAAEAQLEKAATEAAPPGLELRQFSSMLDAHVWANTGETRLRKN